MASDDLSRVQVISQRVFDWQDSDSIPDQTAFDGQVSNLFPEFECDFVAGIWFPVWNLRYHHFCLTEY